MAVVETLSWKTRAAPEATVQTVADCFATVLGIDDPAWDDDFFALGGDSVAAVELALRINEALGLSLPMTAAFDAPNIRTLTEFCRRFAGRDGSAPILLRSGEGTPVFLLPGASGIGAGMRRLALALDTGRPVYAFDYPGLYGDEAPLDQVPALAAHLLPALVAACPSGPLILGGYSSGGLVAYDMACRLAAEAKRPALLLLIDSPISRVHYNMRDTLRIWRRRAAQHWRTMRALRARDLFGYGAKRAPALLRDLVPPKSKLVVHEGSVSDAGALAARRYDPPYYSGRTVLLWSQAQAEHNPLDILWARRVPNLAVVKVAGSHDTVMTVHLGQTAAAVSAALTSVGV